MVNVLLYSIVIYSKLVLLHSFQDTMAEFCGEVMELSTFLEKHDLHVEPSKRLPLFRKMNITGPNSIFGIKVSREHYEALSSEASSKKEQLELRKLLGIPHTTVDSQAEIESKLEEAGLDSNFWLQIFKDELGVTSLRALMHVGEESFGMLQHFVRVKMPWEKKALRKLLGMKDEETSFQTQRLNQRQKLLQQQKESHEMLEQLKVLHQEGKKRHDEKVQQVESVIRETLQIPGYQKTQP